ncbi:fumarylacetoacetate hydrolase domain-containing protein 2-like, partial [Geospiza fortis]|uniref:Fumarylacetoacetate hydrolase domain-containing protein 2-like n=1 Tax=Geospiza fortis TaxID=48883 RepID=A0A6I9HUW8_GEOFO
GGPRLGLEEAPGGDLVDLSAAEPELPRSMREFLEIGPRGLELAQRALRSGQHRVPRGAARLLAPVGGPQKVICVGLHYPDQTFDTFCPLGPAIVTREAVPDVHNLWIRCSVNGQRMQDSNTRHLIFGVPALVAWVSRFVTLVPGDVLLTGTPAGVGLFRQPPVFLKPGDEVQCEIEELGTICNRVV